MTQKITVITGAAGLIGSGVVRHLNDLGLSQSLVLVDNLNHPDKSKNLRNKHYREIISIEKFHAWLKGRESEIEAIFHLGACSDTLEQNEHFLRENNTLFTQHLAQYCLKSNIRFIYASSAATYGDGKLGFSDDHQLLKQLQPLNLYAKSKHAFDLWALKEGILDQIVGLKYFNVFGPNEFHKGRMASIILKMVPVIEKEGKIQLFKSTEPDRFKDGEQCRDFIYVKDAVDMTCRFREDKRGGIFNIGMGTPTTWKEMAHYVFKALNKPVNIEYIEMPQHMASQYQNYTCADMSKYGPYRFLYSVERAVEDYIKNYLIFRQAW